MPCSNARARILIRKGQANVETNWKYCKLLLRNDVYTYEIKTPAIPPLPEGSGSLAY
jgi:hypothetical protein